MFVPRPAPYSDSGTFDVWRNVNLGAARVGGCPGFPDSIEGEIVTSRYADSVGPEYGLPQSAGIDVVQTVIATSEDPYGDFVCYRWEIINRDPVAKGPWHAGTFADWDLASGSSNTGRFTDLANGYFIWDPSDASYACGMIDPDQKSEYQGADPMTAPPYRIWVDDVNPCATFSIGCWGFPWESAQNWNRVVRQLPLRINEGLGPTDLGGLLINPPVNLPPNGSAVIHQVLFHVDASSNNASTIEANAVALATRAARWTGFARGDVNDDGYVDLAYVCWLNAGLPIYPGDYCADVDVDGDVDAQDQTYLLAFLSGNGPAPAGAWRFGIPPAGP